VPNWIRQDEANRGERTDRPTTAEAEELRRLRKGERRTAEGQRNLEGGERLFRPGDRPDKEEVLRTVEHLHERFGIDPILRVFGVAPSSYYGWMDRRRNPSARQRADAEVLTEITAIHDRSGGTYKSPRAHATLRRRSVAVSRQRIERLMREARPARGVPAQDLA